MRFSASSRARTSLARMVRYQLAKRRAGTHKTKGRAEIAAHRQEAVQAEGHGRRPSRFGARAAVPRRRRAFGPVVRSHAHDLPKKVRALALKHALSAKAEEGGDHRLGEGRARRRQDQGAARRISPSSAHQCADHRRRQLGANFAMPPATFRRSTCCRCRASMFTTFCAVRSSC